MLSAVVPVFKSIKNIEVMKYSEEFQYINLLWYAKKISTEDSCTLLRSISDVMIYNLFQSREINFRPSDLSSIFRNPNWYIYIKRLFNKGGEDCAKNITKKNILHIVTHNLYVSRDLIQKSFKDRLLMVEVARDPIYMLKQVKYNQDSHHGQNNPRHLGLVYKSTGLSLIDGQKCFDDPTLDNWERAVNFLERRIQHYIDSTKGVKKLDKSFPFFIFFEDFVKDPYPYLNELITGFEITFNKNLKSFLKKEKLPREHQSDGRNLNIYKEIGWTKLRKEKNDYNDIDCYLNHYKKIGVNHQCLKRLISLSEKYRDWKSSLIRNYI